MSHWIAQMSRPLRSSFSSIASCTCPSDMFELRKIRRGKHGQAQAQTPPPPAYTIPPHLHIDIGAVACSSEGCYIAETRACSPIPIVGPVLRGALQKG